MVISKYINYMSIFLFLIAICLPSADLILKISPNVSVNENRNLASFPQVDLSWSGIKGFPSAFEVYFKDHFGLRKPLIFLNSLFKYEFFRSSSNTRVIVGKEGWLYLRDGEKDILGLSPFTEKELYAWRVILENRSNWLASRGIHYLFVIGPSKSSIYPEYLPSSMRKVREQTRIDQLTDYLRTNSKVDVLDLRDSLKSASLEKKTYYKRDLHWNIYGGFIATQEIIKHLSDSFPDIKDFSPEDILVNSERKTRYPDLAGMLSLQRYFGFDDDVNVIPLRATELKMEPLFELPLGYDTRVNESFSWNRNGVMFHDSFGNVPSYFLSQRLRRLYAVESADMHFLPEIIEREAPDFVIDLFLESKLSSNLAVTPKDFDDEANKMWKNEYSKGLECANPVTKILNSDVGKETSDKYRVLFDGGSRANSYILQMKVDVLKEGILSMEVETGNSQGRIRRQILRRKVIPGDNLIFIPIEGQNPSEITFSLEGEKEEFSVNFEGLRCRPVEIVSIGDDGNVVTKLSDVFSDGWTMSKFNYIPKNSFKNLHLKLWMPSQSVPNRLFVDTDNKTSIFTLKKGSQEFILPFSMFYKFRVEHPFIPKAAGVGEDSRQLGVLIESAVVD